MKIKTIIIAIICIILPYSSIARKTYDNCKGYENADDCWGIAGCEYSGSGDGQGNAGCKACSISRYCTGIDKSSSSCPTPTLDCAEEAKCSTNGYLLSGLESVDECIQYTLLKITLPQAYYFEAPSTLNPNDKAYKTKECSKQTLNGRKYSGKPENDDEENSSLTIGELKEKYSLNDRCILCEENQVPNDNGIGCKDEESKSCKAGQYLNTEGQCIDCDKGTYQPINGYVGNACRLCDEGTYQSESGKSECLECEPGSIAPKLGTLECTRCNTSTTKGTNDKRTTCICQTGFHDPEGPNSDYETQTESCTAIAYYVNYEPNCQSDKLDTKQSENSYTINETITYQDDIFTCPGYNFSGWKAQNGITYTQNILVSDVITDETEYIKLTAQWTAKEFKVSYNGKENTGGDKPTEPTTCTYGDETCKAPDNSYMNAGFIFKNWSCQYMPQAGQTLKPCRKTGCGTGTCEISPGDDISTISDGNDIILTAIWESCPNGYYCPGTDPNPKTEPQACPAGSTTDGDADSIYDCHMVGGTTQICGDNGCFDLPKGVGELFYGVEKEN